jgi:hypothetical protein
MWRAMRLVRANKSLLLQSLRQCLFKMSKPKTKVQRRVKQGNEHSLQMKRLFAQ